MTKHKGVLYVREILPEETHLNCSFTGTTCNSEGVVKYANSTTMNTVLRTTIKQNTAKNVMKMHLLQNGFNNMYILVSN